MKKYRFFAFLVAALLVISALVCPVSAEPASRPDTSGAVSVLIYNLDSDSLVFSQNCEQLILPCSTVKIMVALIAIEHFASAEQGFDTPITVPAEVIRESTGLTMELRRGETLTARDLIAGTVIAGANDAAHTLALAIDGSIDAFLLRMNQKAKDFGMNNTTFYNVSGLDQKPCTTANDLLLLGKKAYENAFYMELAGSARYTVVKTEQHSERTLYTRNHLLTKQTYTDYYYECATGMNAGATDGAGYCIVASARVNNQNYLCIVMGAAKHENFTLAKALFQWASDTHGYRVILSEKDILAEISVALGRGSDYIAVIPRSELVYFMPMYLDMKTAITIETEMFFETLTAPVKAGLVVGQANVYLEGNKVATVELITASSLAKDHSALFSRRLQNFLLSSTFLWTLAIVIPVCLAYVLITARIRYLRIVKQVMEVPEEDEESTGGNLPSLPDRQRKD